VILTKLSLVTKAVLRGRRHIIYIRYIIFFYFTQVIRTIDSPIPPDIIFFVSGSILVPS
jgi:hypothetical protein